MLCLNLQSSDQHPSRYNIKGIYLKASMVMVAVRGGCVCVGWWWEGGCDVIFNITERGLELIFFVLEGGTV